MAEKKPKEYLTARVTQGLTDRFRAAIPEGFQFGRAVEVALEIFMDLPTDYQWAALSGKKQPSFREAVIALIDERIAQGQSQGKHLRPPHTHKPSAKGSAGPSERGPAPG